MLKFKQGYIQTTDGRKQDIIVDVKSPINIKDLLIGGMLVVMGITHLTRSAFKKGSECYEDAEIKTLNDLGLIE